MFLSRLNIVLAATLVVVLILSMMSPVDYSRPNIEVLPDMKYTPAWTTYEPNRIFYEGPDYGPTLQAPVVGSIARGEMPLHYEATEEDAIRAGEELQNPYHARSEEPVPPANEADNIAPGEADSPLGESEAGGEAPPENPEQASPTKAPQETPVAEDPLRLSVQRGNGVYRIYCISCHGPKGAGDGPVAQRGFPRQSLLTGKSPQMKDGQLFHVLTYGQTKMPDFAAQLPPDSRWDVINYIRSLQAAAPVAAAPVAAETSEPPADEQ